MALKHALIDLTPLRDSARFRRLWAGRALSGLGTQMTLIAVMFQVWQLSHSTVWTGAVGLAQAAPLVALGLLAGTLLDRMDRRRIYLVAIVGQALCSLLLAAQSGYGGATVVGVLALVAVQSTCGAAGGPAARTFIPTLLPPGKVAAGLALTRITFQASLLFGPVLGGLIIGWLGVTACYVVDAVSFGFAFHGAFGLPTTRALRVESGPAIRALRAGIRYLMSDRTVGAALLTDLAATVLSFPVSLFPLINAERFGNDPRTLGLLLSALALGGVIAAAASGVFTRLPRPGTVMLVGSAVWGASLAAFGLATNPVVALSLLVLAGISDTVAVVSRGTVVQVRTPDALRGRVAGAEQVVGHAGPDLGNMRAGVIAHASTGTVAILSGGLACLLVVALIAALTPELRNYRPADATEPARGHESSIPTTP